ncbi:MAG: hypothetical protein ACFFER_12510 [Candidatus Thorarchaeota archaeon]
MREAIKLGNEHTLKTSEWQRLILVRMEPIDAFTIIVVLAMFGEAYSRNRLNKRVDFMLKDSELQGRTPEFPRDIQVELMSVPTPPDEWSPGLGAYLNARPMLIFFVIIMGWAGLLTLIGLVATVPKMILAILAVVLVVALHSGPDLYTLIEYFLQIAAEAEIDFLSDRQLGLLSRAKTHFEGWVLLQVFLSTGLLVGVLLPIDLAALYVLVLTIIIFLALGCSYQIQRGIFARP